MTLIDFIEEQMMTDDEDRYEQSVYLAVLYEKASQQDKELIDKVFIYLCGYSLNTLLDMNHEEKDNL